LKFDIVIVYFEKFRTKLYSDGDLMFLSVSFVSVLEKKTRLADTWIWKNVPESPMIMYLRRNAYDIAFTLRLIYKSIPKSIVDQS
jgi:hypothetical protein